MGALPQADPSDAPDMIRRANKVAGLEKSPYLGLPAFIMMHQAGELAPTGEAAALIVRVSLCFSVVFVAPPFFSLGPAKKKKEINASLHQFERTVALRTLTPPCAAA